MKKSYNYKFIVGLVIGILSIGVVYASGSILSSSIIYDSDNSSLSDGFVQGAIDDLASKLTDECPIGYGCQELKTTLAVGDYISYTPVTTSYTTDKTKTGYSSTETIKPSELNLWRVLSINDDGTVDIISEYVTSKNVYFKGKVGYLNFVGYLNELASKYETEGITVGSRYFGYDGQTEYLPDSSIFTQTTAPWTTVTSNNNNEGVGGGDTLHQTDYNLVKTVLGTGGAYKVGTTTLTTYWIASRYYSYSSSSTTWGFNGRFVSESGTGNFNFYYYNSGFNESSYRYALRPIVTLDSELQYEGLGTEDVPMEIKG